MALSAISAVAMAQVSTEVGLNLGSSNYLGDLQVKDYTYRQSHLSTGVWGRYNATSMLSFRAFFGYGRLSGADYNSNVQNLINRNLSFRSYVAELGIQAEVSALPFNKYDPNRNKDKRYFNYTPYFFGGINVFGFNPKTFYKNQWIELRDLHTEGQNSTFNTNAPYRLTQVAIPFGMGFKYQASKHILVAVELGFRKTFTDYIDDVSGYYPNMTKLATEKGTLTAELTYRGDELAGMENTAPIQGTYRGNPDNLDWYVMNSVSVSYKFYHGKKK